MSPMIIIISVVVIVSIILGVVVWDAGLKDQNIGMTMLGAFLALNIVGLAIGAVQASKFEVKPREQKKEDIIEE